MQCVPMLTICIHIGLLVVVSIFPDFWIPRKRELSRNFQAFPGNSRESLKSSGKFPFPGNPKIRENWHQTWDSKMTSKIFIDMAASFWFFLSFLAKSISFYFRNQIYTALGFQKYSHCNKVLYISPWTIPFYTSDVSLLTKKSLIFAIFYTCESGVLLKYG